MFPRSLLPWSCSLRLHAVEITGESHKGGEGVFVAKYIYVKLQESWQKTGMRASNFDLGFTKT